MTRPIIDDEPLRIQLKRRGTNPTSNLVCDWFLVRAQRPTLLNAMEPPQGRTVKEVSSLERRSSAWLMFLRRRLSIAAISLSCSLSTCTCQSNRLSLTCSLCQATRSLAWRPYQPHTQGCVFSTHLLDLLVEAQHLVHIRPLGRVPIRRVHLHTVDPLHLPDTQRDCLLSSPTRSTLATRQLMSKGAPVLT